MNINYKRSIKFDLIERFLFMSHLQFAIRELQII